MISPIGDLLKRAEKRGHAEAVCGCEVRLSWFSTTSYTVHFEHCTEHFEKKEEPS